MLGEAGSEKKITFFIFSLQQELAKEDCSNGHRKQINISKNIGFDKLQIIISLLDLHLFNKLWLYLFFVKINRLTSTDFKQICFLNVTNTHSTRRNANTKILLFLSLISY